MHLLPENLHTKRPRELTIGYYVGTSAELTTNSSHQARPPEPKRPTESVIAWVRSWGLAARSAAKAGRVDCSRSISLEMRVGLACGGTQHWGVPLGDPPKPCWKDGHGGWPTLGMRSPGRARRGENVSSSARLHRYVQARQLPAIKTPCTGLHGRARALIYGFCTCGAKCSNRLPPERPA